MSWRTLSRSDKVYTYEYFLRDNICRICWQCNANNELSLELNQNKGEISLNSKIKECLNIDMKSKSNLNKICDSCSNEIENFFEFKNFCKRNEMLLNDIVEKHLAGNSSDVEDSDNRINPIESYFEIQLEEYGKESKAREMKLRKRLKRKLISRLNCRICFIDFPNKDELTKHKSELHGVEENGTVFKCFGCEKRFNSRRRRLGHENEFCKGLKDGYKCPICDRYLPKRRMYERHMMNHRTNTGEDLPEYLFKCKLCKECFKSKKSLKEHKKAHGDEKLFVCDTCGRTFSRHDYLQKHILTHTGERRHKCPHCDFRATQKSSLTVHIRRKHTGERPYSCDVCPQQCTSSSNLLAHKRRHLGLKKYECKICKKKFGYKLSLEEHISSAHEQSESHICDVCGASYTRIRGLRRHQIAKHGKSVTRGKTDHLDRNGKDDVDEQCRADTDDHAEVDDDGLKLDGVAVVNKSVEEKMITNIETKNEELGIIEYKEILLVKNQDVNVYLV